MFDIIYSLFFDIINTFAWIIPVSLILFFIVKLLKGAIR